jgi:hypothetical protein
VVVLGVEKKSILQLQDSRTVRKVVMLDDHVCLAFAGAWATVLLNFLLLYLLGLTADGRVLIDKARIECQSHRLTVEDPVTVEYITRHIAGIQQVHTTCNVSRRIFTDCNFGRNTPNLEVFVLSASPLSLLVSTPMMTNHDCIKQSLAVYTVLGKSVVSFTYTLNRADTLHHFVGKRHRPLL